MHTVVTEVQRPDQSLVEQFKQIPTAVLSDVTTKYENTMTHEIKPVSEDVRMAGTAITVKTYPGDNLMVHKAITLAEPEDVLVVDANQYTEAGIWGELASTSSKHHRLAGTIIDGAVRDIDEIREMEYPVYARAVSPKGSYKAHPGSINVPISCGGVSIEPGDIVVGDDEGVAIVGAEEAESVLVAAKEKLSDEEAMIDRIKQGEYIFSLAGFDEKYEELDIRETSGESTS
jgi:4-hydroxy-4-methyl-2-oxoglutarate aldolase